MKKKRIRSRIRFMPRELRAIEEALNHRLAGEIEDTDSEKEDYEAAQAKIVAMITRKEPQ